VSSSFKRLAHKFPNRCSKHIAWLPWLRSFIVKKKKSAVPAALNSESEGFTQAAAAELFLPPCGAGRVVENNDGEGATGHDPIPQHLEPTAASEGTPPSHTVPCNYNPSTFKALRFGVDSLYLSYPGVLSEDWDKKLSGLKEIAKSESEAEQALAQVVIGGHIFEVKDRGRGKFAYVMVDNNFHIQASNKNSTSMPMAYVQISSEYLAAVGVEQAEKSLSFIVNTLGLVDESANISRVDLFVDFIADLRMDSFNPLEEWVTRTQSIDLHYRYNQFSGWSFGMGGEIGARMYNKQLEIEKKSHAFYLHELWLDAGWDGSSKVWRMEFEAKREVLKQLGICKLNDLLQLQAALWIYLAEDWLRLAVPSTTDTNQTRWLNHPLWDQITAVFNHQIEQPKLTRFNPARLPEDERLFVHGLGGLTSFMASRGIDDLGEGIGEYVHHAKEYHTVRSGYKHDGMAKYVEQKVKAKNRKFNTVDNQKNMETASRKLKEETEGFERDKDQEHGDA